MSHRTEFAVRYTHYDRTVTYDAAGDLAHAELIADGKATHLASLNEATRQLGGIDEVDIVSRTVREDEDDTHTSRWQLERPGVPWKSEAGA